MVRSRRRVLELLGTGSTVALAGCTGSGKSTEPPPSETGPATTTDSETHTPDTEPPMSTVFHFASGTAEQQHAVANVANLLADDSTDVENVVLVVNGAGIKLVSTEDSEVPEEVKQLVESGVSVRACRNSMEAFDLEDADLFEGVETVPAGVGELTKLQARDDYAYIETP